MPTPTALDPTQILCDDSVQPRSAINALVVQRYADDMIAGDTFPPCDVFRVGEMLYAVDGFHRVAAARLACLPTLAVNIHDGTLRDARLFSASTNFQHGLPRSRADERRAVERVLLESPEWSDSAIAAHCHIRRRQFVSEVRRVLGEAVDSKIRTVKRGET